MAEVDAYQNAFKKRVETLIIRMFRSLGDECVKEARDRSEVESWFNQSGKLRSSIGYVIVNQGIVIYTSSFEVIKEGSEGATEGRNLAISLASRFNKGLALIVVAGVNYAAKVEAINSKVVLASAELYHRKNVPIMIRQLKTQVA